MSEESSLEMDEDLDVAEGAVIKTVQSSMFEKKTPSVIETRPEVRETPLQVDPPTVVSEKKQLLELSISEISSLSDNKRENFVPAAYKNFLQRNIEITKSKKTEVNLEGIEIEALMLEEEEKRVPVNVDERFYKYQDKVNEKIQNLAKELKEKEMEMCTFKPEVKGNKKKRTTDQFLSQMKSYERIKNEKIEALRNLKKDPAENEPVHHPVINQKSKEIVAKKGEASEPIYEKLYKAAVKEKPLEPVAQPPKKKSTRAEPIEKTLYEDALRRAAKQVEPKVPVKEPQISFKSEQVLAKKFIKDFLEVTSAVGGIEGDTISRDCAIKALVCLNFIRNNPEHPKHSEENSLIERFFKIISVNNEIKTQNMLKLSLATLNIYIPSMTVLSEAEPPSQQGQLIDGSLSITKEEVLKYHKLFNVFYSNRQLSNQIIKQNAAESYSFQPKLTPETKALAKEAQKRAGSLCSAKRDEFLQEERKKTQEKMEKLRREKEEQEAKSCTFRPVLMAKSHSKTETTEKNRGLALYERSKELQEKKQIKMKEVSNLELDKDMSECTFVPRLEKIKVKEDTEVLNSKGVQQQLMRMQKAREEQERKKSILERPVSGKMNFGIEYSHKSKTAFRPPLAKQRSPVRKDNWEVEQEDKDDSNPKQEYCIEDHFGGLMLEENEKKSEQEEEEEIQLEVKMPNGSHKTLVILPGEDKELKISMFILQNKLNEDLGRKLRLSLLNM